MSNEDLGLTEQEVSLIEVTGKEVLVKDFWGLLLLYMRFVRSSGTKSDHVKLFGRNFRSVMRCLAEHVARTIGGFRVLTHRSHA